MLKKAIITSLGTNLYVYYFEATYAAYYVVNTHAQIA
jgi:hypothetical protein